MAPNAPYLNVPSFFWEVAVDEADVADHGVHAVVNKHHAWKVREVPNHVRMQATKGNQRRGQAQPIGVITTTAASMCMDLNMAIVYTMSKGSKGEEQDREA